MNCPVCESNNLEFIFQFKDTPALQQKLYYSLKSALTVTKEEINLYGCNQCGFVFNKSFDEKKVEYSANYDNTQDYSEYFYTYLTKLAKRLISKYSLRNKSVIEVGCGKGHFLKLLYQLGVKNIKGYDPAYINYDPIVDKLVTRKLFNKKNVGGKVDFIVCRHVLEHIPQPKKFISSIVSCLKEDGRMYFEFPSLEWIIKNGTFFDFFYEHCNYFSKTSVKKLFQQFGHNNLIFNEGLDGQYFQIETDRNNRLRRSNEPNKVDFKAIMCFLNRKTDYYKKALKKIKNYIIWGAAAKGITLVHRLQISHNQCQFLIDINKNKQNKFISITGQQIVPPEILKKKKIMTIVIMNPVYGKEIKAIAKENNYKGKFLIL